MVLQKNFRYSRKQAQRSICNTAVPIAYDRDLPLMRVGSIG